MPNAIEQQLVSVLSPHGLHLRGGFAPTAADALPALPNRQPAASVWLVGVVGSAFWPHFQSSAFYNDGQPDPLDRWSRAIGNALAARWGGLALFPFDGPPYHPFQRWADRAEPTQASKLMLRIHPDYGLWHAYRFALALPAWVCDQAPDSEFAAVERPGAKTLPAIAPPPALQPPASPADLCATCSGQPCLQACPVNAYTGAAFLLEACASHLHSGQGGDCMLGGCLARRACPVAPAKRYAPEHAAFHMRAFAAQH